MDKNKKPESDDDDFYEDDELLPTATTTTIDADINFQWSEITSEFERASRDLELGELLHDANFGLFEAMSAIEMMDPKMDAGMLCNQTKRKVRSLEQAIDDKTIAVDNLTPEQLIGIMDATLCCLVTWLEGHSLAQTVFTNLYLHNPSLIEDRSLKAFSVCALKLVDIIRERINRALVYEEEDFQPMSYGFKMSSDVSDARACGMIKEVEDEWSRAMKNTRCKAGGSDTRDERTQTQHELSTAVYARLRFVRLFFSAMVAFSRDKCVGLDDAVKCLNQIEDLLPAMVNTLALGIVPTERSADGDDDYSTLMGFEPLINQRLLPPTFPRYTKIKSRAETMEYLLDVTGRLKLVWQVKDIPNLHAALEFFIDYSKTAPCVLSRSILQLVYLSPSRRILGQHLVADVLRDTIRAFIAPPALSPKNNALNGTQAKEYIDAFLQHASRPICSMLQLCGHNRARQRDKWVIILEELSGLQDEADKVDAYLHGVLVKSEPNRQHLVCFGTWVLYHTLQTMINYTLSGFELELYSPHEYQYIYWYLHECLYNWLISTISRAETFVVEQLEATAGDAASQKGGRQSKKASKKKKKTRPMGQEIAINQAYQSLCTGFYKAVVALNMDRKMQEAKFEFDGAKFEEVRFNHRFAPFRHVLTPPVIQYGVYKEMAVREEAAPSTASDVYISASKSFLHARMLLECLTIQSEEVELLVKVAKTNFVVMKLCAGGHKKDSTAAAEFDFTTHRMFPIIKVN
ncbi:N-alpha-acetyltransferase 35, NatC auxiliary subunit-like [Tubulanus polymorphus]|uniref:N-alpha-acetyltransferase 35, NatC auxiliary subunit-like n=1 Tax=Tubulanus polymorphus TaxID=672921 RepID=UPI003DA1EBD8